MAYVQGIITVTAKDEQEARAAALAQYHEDGTHFSVGELYEEYPVRIHSVDPV